MLETIKRKLLTLYDDFMFKMYLNGIQTRLAYEHGYNAAQKWKKRKPEH